MSRRLSDYFDGVAAQLRAAEGWTCFACGSVPGDRAACGNPRHADACADCDADLEHEGGKP